MMAASLPGQELQWQTVQLTMQEHEQHPLPWFGAIQGLVLVPPQHSLDVRSEPAALMTLNEGGQLIVYDMKTLKPLPLFLPLQELPPITASAFLHEAPPPEVGTASSLLNMGLTLL